MARDNAATIDIPATVLELFEEQKPADAIRQWLKLVSTEHNKAAKDCGIGASAFSSKLAGKYSWTIEELTRLYRYLSGHTKNDATTIALEAILSLSGPETQGERVHFARALRQEAIQMYRVSVVSQGPLVDMIDGVAVGGLRELTTLLLRRNHPPGEDPDISWVQADDLDVGAMFDLAKNPAPSHIALGLYPTIERRAHAKFVPIPGLTVPLVAIMDRRHFFEIAKHTTAPAEGDLDAWSEWLQLIANNIALRRELLVRSKVAVVRNEAGHNYVRGFREVDERKAELEIIERYNAMDCASRYLSLHDSGEMPMLVVDDLMADIVANKIIDQRQTLHRQMVVLGPAPNIPPFVFSSNKPEFAFDVSLPRFKASVAIANEDESLGTFFEDEISRLADQEPETLIECLYQGFERLSRHDTNLAWRRMRRYLDPTAFPGAKLLWRGDLLIRQNRIL